MIGFLNINKPKGLNSSKVVAAVKKLLKNGEKVGHMGTLDPIASGVLPIAIGRATRLFGLMQDKKKEYIATFKFGYTTDTLDSTGVTTNTTTVIPSKQQIEEKLNNFIGEIAQLPPSFSAKMVDGKRAYDMARKGQEVKLNPCKVVIYSFDLLEQVDRDTYKFKIECGSGTYIRSLCRDLALALNSYAVMTDLVRTKTGPFCLENSQNYDNIDLDKVTRLDEVFEFSKLHLTEDELRTLLDGKKIKKDCKDGTYWGCFGDQLQLVVTFKDGNPSNKIWLR